MKARRRAAKRRLGRGEPGARAPHEPSFSSLVTESWRKHAPDLPAPPTPYLDLIEGFVLSVRPDQPHRACAVLMIALDLCHTPEMFISGEWVFLVSTHVYVHFRGGGYAALRTLATVERFLTWMRDEELLEAWDLSRLLHHVDDARESAGASRRHPSAYERCFVLGPSANPLGTSVDALIEEFVGSVPLDPVLRSCAPSAVRIIVSYCAHPNRLVRFGVLDPVWLVDLGCEECRRNPDHEAHRAFLTILVRLYRWLGDRRYLEPRRATELADQLTRLSMAPPQLRLVASN